MGNSKKIQLQFAKAQELDPAKAYLIQLDESFSLEELDLLSAKLKDFGLKKVIVVIGNVTISEVKNADTTGS
jgi:hypothetical protein